MRLHRALQLQLHGLRPVNKLKNAPVTGFPAIGRRQYSSLYTINRPKLERVPLDRRWHGVRAQSSAAAAVYGHNHL